MTTANKSEWPKVLLFARDLIFETRIRSTADSMEIALQTVRDSKAALDLFAASHVSGMIVDLDRGEEAIRAIELMRRERPSLLIVAYGPHVEAAIFERAKAAGADEVLPRSRFTQQLPAILLSATSAPD